MTVKELINWLSEFDEDAEVVIGMQQTYGTDFAMEIENVSEEKFNSWDIDDSDITCVVITEGRQVGGVDYEERW